MILTVTLNPLLERRLYFEKIVSGAVNRSIREEYSAGGKGINVSRQLSKLGVSNQALTFAGGHNGKIFRKMISDEGLDFVLVGIKDETRSALLAIEAAGKPTSYFGPDSVITEKEADNFKLRFEKMVRNVSAVVFSGSAPSGPAEKIFPWAIDLANSLDKMTILDTYGKHLKECVEAAPAVVHLNRDEAVRYAGINPSSEHFDEELFKYLYKSGVRLAFVTDGPDTVYASKFDFIYKADPPEVTEEDPTGSGDAFLAGIIYGLENSMVFDDFLKTGIALGSANARMWSVCDVSPAEYQPLLNSINLTPVGKKMKLIDDSPNY